MTAVRRKDLDHALLTSAWKRAWNDLPDDERERVMAAADEHGGFYNVLTIEADGGAVLTMAGVEVLRCPARTLVRKHRGRN